jgi:hypothetical protein
MTLRRYNRQIDGLNVVATYIQTTLNWWNLTALPPAEWLEPGMCLEDSTGRRFPALKPIAMKLLAQGRGVKLLTQTMNYYWYGNDTLPPTSSAAARLKAEIGVSKVEKGREAGEWRNRIERFVRIIGERVGIQEQPVQGSVTTVQAAVNDPYRSQSQNGSERVSTISLPKRSSRYYGKVLPDPDHEVLAVKVYQRINQAPTEKENCGSLATTRRWVDVYGTTLVKNALNLLEQRRNILRPSGFMATVLRSTAKFGADSLRERC